MLLHAAKRDAEARDDFIEDERRAVAVGELAQVGVEGARLVHPVVVRRDDDRRQVVAVLLPQLFKLLDVVPGGCMVEGGEPHRDARLARGALASRQSHGVGGKGVQPAVVAALDDVVVPRDEARPLDACRARLAASLQEASLLRAGDDLRNGLGDLCLQRAWIAEDDAVVKLCADGGVDGLVVVAERDGTQRILEVNILLAVGVLHAASLAADKNRWLLGGQARMLRAGAASPGDVGVQHFIVVLIGHGCLLFPDASASGTEQIPAGLAPRTRFISPRN